MNFLLFIKNQKGETITETLVATLIAALAMILFASMIVASKHIIESGERNFKHYYEWNSKMSVKDDEVKNSNTGKVKFYHKYTEEPHEDTEEPLVFGTDDNYYKVKIYFNQEASDDAEISNRIYSY
ncbi:MAG: hypothetical protein E7232_13355 [Lachnospiraceae bacterium]|jgi:hypothetical protein|nr:hypothetical protein [Lachnospiraceae bacterium]